MPIVNLFLLPGMNSSVLVIAINARCITIMIRIQYYCFYKRYLANICFDRSIIVKKDISFVFQYISNEQSGSGFNFKNHIAIIRSSVKGQVYILKYKFNYIFIEDPGMYIVT